MPFELWLCSLDGPNITQVEQIMAYIHSSTSWTSLWSLLERASSTCSVPLVPELHSSLKALKAFESILLERRRETLIHSMSALHHCHDNRQAGNNASPNRRHFQPAYPSCQISYIHLVQEPHPKPRADRTSCS